MPPGLSTAVSHRPQVTIRATLMFGWGDVGGLAWSPCTAEPNHVSSVMQGIRASCGQCQAVTGGCAPPRQLGSPTPGGHSGHRVQSWREQLRTQTLKGMRLEGTLQPTQF